MAMSHMASTLPSPLSFLLLRHSLPPYIPRQHSLSSPLSKRQHSHQILCAKKSSSSSNNSKQQKPKAQTASSSLGPKAGIAIYKPKSYEVLAADAANSLAFALQDGKTRLEIDFPPLPSNISSYKGSSDEFIDANIQLALAVVRKLQERMETRACIVFPDKPEKGRASRLFKTALDSIDGITIGSLDDVPTGAVRSFFSSIRNTLDFDFDDQEEVMIAAGAEVLAKEGAVVESHRQVSRGLTIREQLDRIEAASSSSSKAQIAPDTPQSSKIGVLERDDQTSIASSDVEAFQEESTPKANKIHWELALPTVKTPPDLAIDNRPSALNQSRYNASSVYEWNIDGMSEYNILGLLQQMTMAANAYKTQAGTSDRAISEILIAGFTGQLKGWWDHLLTNRQQLDILNSIQTDENGAPILDEFNNPIQDAVATLILTISLHFIGDPSHLRDKNAELLHNLRCRKLSEFQSYKTSFFTRLFLRDDANHTTWKEKFLAGLPTLLGEKVRNSIKALYDNRIPYDELTYGELVSFVNKEGLKICQDLKLQKRLKWELKKSKQELGGFCKQFNYDPFKTSISKDCNGECSSKTRRKHYKSKHFRKPFRDFKKLPYKKPSRPYKRQSFSKKKELKAKPITPFNFKDATCFKCGMKGHTAKFCRMNKRLHELDLDEDILSKLAPLLVEFSDSESSMSGDNDPYQVDELFDSDDSASSSSESESDSFLKKINVLTKDQETFLELVKHISDPNLQKEYLDKLLKTLDFNKAETSKVPIVKTNSYDLTQILDKKKTKKSTPTIQDLQNEIKQIKLEIKDLKEKQKSDSDTIQLLLQKQLQDNSDNESNPDNDGDDIKVENIESVPNDFLFVLKQITTRKYLIKVTLIFSDDFAMDAIALFDTGADLNCIREDIVPKRFHEKTKEKLSAANNSKLNVSSKVEASIYNNQIEFKTSFVLTNDIHHAIILGTPFINLITPYAVNYDAQNQCHS
ncbi:protein LOW PSII ACCUMULATION 3 [Citrus sinensis]|nr:protein LOW PSII ACCUMULATION 3 [Citrus sinensis]